MKLKRVLCLRVLPMLLAATAISSAATFQVVLDATKQGAVFSGFVLPGGTVTSVDSPVLGNSTTPGSQFLLPAGTYTITDGDTSTTGSAWDYSTAATGPAWLWDFAVVQDSNDTVLLRDYIGTSGSTLAFFASRTAAAQAQATTTNKFYGGVNGTTVLSATSTTSFSETLTLGTATLVDFIIPDGVITDNLGGMTLTLTQNQTGVPEPASFFLVAGVLAAGCLRLRRRA